MSQPLFTIGHSNHTLERFIDLLRQHEITAIGDVRSSPYSRYCPQFDQSSLKNVLPKAGIVYVFLGKELGARAEQPSCYINGRVSYERLAQRPEFAEGLERVQQGMQKYRLALLCAEKDPVECHRMILICRRLRAPDLAIQHILADGSLEANEAAETRLRDKFHLQPTLFDSEAEVTEQAYERQGERIAYRADEETDDEP